MKKLLLILGFLFLLSGCTSEENVRNDLSATELFDEIIEHSGMDASSLTLTDEFIARNESLNGLDFENVENFVTYSNALSTEIRSIIIIKVLSDADTVYESAKTALNNSKESLQTFADYFPEEYEKIENAEVIRKGNYIATLILSDDDKELFKTSFDEILHDK